MTHTRFRRRWSGWGIGAIGTIATMAMIAALVAAPAASSAPTTSAPASGVMFGAYANAKGGQSLDQAVTSLENKIGRKLAIVNKYHPFSDHSYGFEQWQLGRGQLPMISWRGTDDTPDPNRASKIANGNFDADIRAAADGLKALHGPVLVRFNWEMDQSPGERQYIGTPAEYIKAWRHIHGIFQARGATNVEFIWAPRAGSFKKDVGQQYYPGDAFVDWIGGSAVPVNNFASFEDLYRSYYTWASTKNKPILIWAGIQEKSGNTQWKAEWFAAAQQVIANTMPELRAFIYYHALAPKGGHFWADTTSQSLAAFKNMANAPHFSRMLDGGGSGGGGGGSSTPPPPPTTTPPPPDPTEPPPPDPWEGSVLFVDDFESGGLDGWSVTNGFTLQTEHARDVWAARQVSSGSGLTFGRRELPGGERFELIYEFDYKVITASGTVSLAKVVTLPSGAPLSLNMRGNGALVTWNAVERVSTGSSVTPSLGNWHHVKIRVNINGSASEVGIWVDGVQVDQLSGVAPLGVSPIGAVQLGNNTSGRSYDVAFDEVQVSVP